MAERTFPTDVTLEICCANCVNAEKLLRFMKTHGEGIMSNYVGIESCNALSIDNKMRGNEIVLIEGHMEAPIAFMDDFIQMLDYLTGKMDFKLRGVKLTYTDEEKKQTGVFTATAAGITHQYLPQNYWPDRCDGWTDYDYEDEIDDAFREHKITNTVNDVPVLDKFAAEDPIDDEPEEKVAADESEKHSDGITLNEYYAKKIENAIEAIAYIDSDFISKIGKAPEVLRQVVNLANAVLAIFQGEAGSELSDIEPLSGEFQEMNNAASDFKDALDNLSEYK